MPNVRTRIVDSTKISRPSYMGYSRFQQTSRRFEAQGNSSDHASGSRQLGVFTKNFTKGSSGRRDFTDQPSSCRKLGGFTRNFNKGFSGRNHGDAKSQAISKWIDNLHNWWSNKATDQFMSSTFSLIIDTISTVNLFFQTGDVHLNLTTENYSAEIKNEQMDEMNTRHNYDNL